MRCLATCSAIFGLLVCTVPARGAETHNRQASLVQTLRRGINWQRSATWRNQDAAFEARTPTRYYERHTSQLGRLRSIASTWNHRRRVAKRQAARLRRLIPHLRLWLCIHSGEAWDWHNADTGRNGHYGGLQMSSPWGRGVYYVYRADWLSPFEQMRKAELGYAASGHSYSWLYGQWAHPECMQFR